MAKQKLRRGPSGPSAAGAAYVRAAFKRMHARLGNDAAIVEACGGRLDASTVCRVRNGKSLATTATAEIVAGANGWTLRALLDGSALETEARA